MAKDGPMFKPWKDGWLENLAKIGGGYVGFLIASGLFGAPYDPYKTNPLAWGWAGRQAIAHTVDFVVDASDRVMDIFDR